MDMIEHEIPVSHEQITVGHKNYQNLTVREYFSIVALQGLLANPNGWDMVDERLTNAAVMLADNLIDTLNKPK